MSQTLARTELVVRTIAQTAGDASVTIRLARADGPTVEQTLYIPVRPATLPVTNRLVVDLEPAASGVVRLPEATDTVLAGVRLKRIVLPGGHPGAAEAVLHILAKSAG